MKTSTKITWSKEQACSDKLKDDFLISIVQSLNFLIELSCKENLATISRILHVAKEDLVYWASELNYYESPRETFIYKNLYKKNDDSNNVILEKILQYVCKT